MTRALDIRRVHGLILAGGQSTRMGQDKALLKWQGETLLSRARALLRTSGIDTIHVGGRPDQPDGLPDSQPHAGPARAILDAATMLRGLCEHILVIPVDMPLLRPEQLVPLLAATAAQARNWHDHPLPAIIQVEACCALPADDIHSIKRLLSMLKAETLALAPTQAGHADPFSNINTPQALARLNETPG